MAKKDKVVVLECRHPLEQAFDQEREHEPGKWDKICGLCGITMCEVLKPADTVKGNLINETYLEQFADDLGKVNDSSASEVAKQEEPVKCVNRHCASNLPSAGDGCALARGLDKPASECSNFIPDASATADEEEGTSVCVNTECGEYSSGEDNGCMQWASVWECERCIGLVEKMAAVQGGDHAATQEEEAPEGTEEGMAVAGDDAGDDAADQGGLKDKLIEHANRDKPEAYVTRDPDYLGPTFTRSLPVPVPDEELAELAKEMSHAHRIWIKAQLDAKASARGFKNIIDQQEAEMVRLAGIIEEGTEERPTVCRWEFDYAAGTKKLRRLDNHQVIDEETLKGEELHLSFNFNGSSEAAVEKLKEAQDEAGTPEAEAEGAEAGTESAEGAADPGVAEPEGEVAAGNLSICQHCKEKHPNCEYCCSACMKSQDCLNSQFCTLQTAMDTGTICAVCVSADCGTHEPTGYTQDCTGFAAEFSTSQIAHNDGICKTWRGCEYQRGCFSEQNEENGDCLSDLAKEAADEAKARERAGIQMTGILADADKLF